ncbi:MAG: class I SAM-dependent methyltransferase [Candidatus Margulisbacteria bacterium]|nr:class I SAM-dependent methyltransferase [Candidatus Margulisiibacteriota bacterium]
MINSEKNTENNSPQLWDGLWQKSPLIEEDIFDLAKEEHSIRWQRTEKAVVKQFGSFNGLKVIELGAGVGTNAALMAKRGAKITILDYSEGALRRAREFFERNGLSAEFIKQDALLLPANLLGKYDISMSFGLTEHFSGPARIKINKAHFDVLKDKGITFISVPNKYNLPYRIFKFLAETAGTWKAGEEYPYSRRELRKICKEIGITKYSFFGDSIFYSFNFISPLRIIKKLLKMDRDLSVLHLKKEKGTFLDQYLSYALVLYGKKSSLT